MSPLAAFIESIGMSDGRLAKRAALHNVEVSDETIRKARKDKFKTPLRPDTVHKLAAALEISEDRIRALDEQRWRKDAGTSPQSVNEDTVMAWIRDALPEDLAEHIVFQFIKLRELAQARGAPIPWTGPGKETDGATPPARPSQRPVKAAALDGGKHKTRH